MNYIIKKNENETYHIIARIQVNGKRYKKEIKTFKGTARQAEKHAIQMVQMLQGQEHSSISRGSFVSIFSGCVSYYLEHKVLHRSNLTYIKRINEDLGDYSIDELPEACDNFFLLLKKSRTSRGVPYSAATINRYKSWISAIVNYAVDSDLITETPFKKRFKKEREIPRDKSLTPEEVEKLLLAIREYRPYLEPLVQFLLLVPCRKSELLNAQKSDIVMGEVPYLRIRNGKTKNNRGVNKPIPPVMMDYFKSIPEECSWAFYREKDGEYYKLKSIDDAFHFCLKKAGINDFRIHDFRHFSATALVDSGVSERAVMDIAGWSTNMLSTYYHKNTHGSLKAVTQVWSENQK